jgi:hypothetical protein
MATKKRHTKSVKPVKKVKNLSLSAKKAKVVKGGDDRHKNWIEL